MPEPIALVTRLSDGQEQEWLFRLSDAMPGETIMPFTAMTPAQRDGARIAIVANPDPADLSALPSLVWVQSLWAGVERLVSEPEVARFPIVRLVDPELARTMAEAGLAWTYYLHRDMPAYARQQRVREWQPRPYRRPGSVTVGILGLGALGTEAARRIADAGFSVVGWSRTAKPVPQVRSFHGEAGLRDVLAQSDIVLVLLPLTGDTRGLLNAECLALMPRGAQIINFGRGPIIDTPALVGALDSGALSHAVLDVFETEPLPADDVLWNHPSVTVLPHVSAPTDPGTAAAIVAGNIAAFRADGTVPPAVDMTRGY